LKLNPQHKFHFEKIIKNKIIPYSNCRKKESDGLPENAIEELNESEQRDKKNLGEDYIETKDLLKYLKVNLRSLRMGFLRENNLSDCDYDTFKKIVSSLKNIPKSLVENEKLIKNIFETHKANNNSIKVTDSNKPHHPHINKNINSINSFDNNVNNSNKLFSPQVSASRNNIFQTDKLSYQNLMDSLIDNQNAENFANHRNHVLNHFRKKLGILNGKLTDSLDILSGELNDKKKFAEGLREDIETRKAKFNEKEKNESETINASVPSLKFINKIFANGKEYLDKYHEIKNTNFSSNPAFHKDLKPNTRFSGNPLSKDTSEVIKPIKDCSSYFDEDQRFFKSVDGSVDFQSFQKGKKAYMDFCKLNRIATMKNVVIKKAHDNEVLLEQKDYLRQLAGTQKMHNYNDVLIFF